MREFWEPEVTSDSARRAEEAGNLMALANAIDYSVRELIVEGRAAEAASKVREARQAFETAVRIFREITRAGSARHCTQLAMALVNYGMFLKDVAPPDEAIEVLREALDLYEALAAKGHHSKDYSWAISILADVYELIGDWESAIHFSRKAVTEVETYGQHSPYLHRIKGYVSASYRRLATFYASQGDQQRLFRCLCAMREGPTRLSDESSPTRVDEARQALEEASRRVDVEVRVVIAQSLPNGATGFAVLNPPGPPWLRYEVRDVDKAAGALASEILSVFDKHERNRRASGYRDRIGQLGHTLWTELPKVVRSVLVPDSQSTVLLSRDDRWNMFPWEALCLDREERSFLGLMRPLTRWEAISAEAFKGLRPIPFGGGERSIGVIAPYDVPGIRESRVAYKEANLVLEFFTKMKWCSLPDDLGLIGKRATAGGIERMLAACPSVMHYVGHGAIVGNEEVLCLWPDIAAEARPMYFGRIEIDRLRRAQECQSKLLARGPLVVLNSCRMGRNREFGGQREDLAWLLRSEGAEAVIASPRPVFDSTAKIFTENLYRIAVSSEIGSAFLEARRCVEERYRTHRPELWPVWALLHLHGNPYACLVPPQQHKTEPRYFCQSRSASIVAKQGAPNQLI